MSVLPGEEGRVDDLIQIALEFAEVKPTLQEMIEIIWVEALRIEGSERARFLWGDRPFDKPHAHQIERIANLHGVVRFLEACRDRPDNAIKWLRKQASAKA